ncbi:MAG: Rieske 2Fe-2S domain-containing protein [bacterium]
MNEKNGRKKVTRRGFVDYLLEGAVVFAAAGFAYPVVRFVIPPKETGGGAHEVNVGTEDEIKPGKAKKFEINGQPAIIINTKTGFSALSAVCTHLGCIVDWDEDKQLIVCPCHNAVFDYNGNIVSGPPPLPLEKLEVTVRGDKVMVRRKG